jgi:hypothetical protein
VVDPADLNNLVDLATAEPGLITEQLPNVGATGTDKVVLNRAGVLHSALVSSLPSGATSVGVAATPTGVFQVTGSPVTGSGVINVIMRVQTGNKILAAPADGSSGDVAFRALMPPDVNKLIVVAAHIIDLDLGNTFFKSLTSNDTLRLKNGTPGQVIKVIVIQGAAPGNFTCAWAADSGTDFLRWPGGTPPVMTTGGAGRTDIYEFTLLQTGAGPNNYYGVRTGANFDV